MNRSLIACGRLSALALAASLGGGLFLSCASGPPVIPWRPDFDQALEDGRNWGKPVLTYLYTDTCPYCKEMEATTFKDPLLVEEMRDEYVWVKLNAETDPRGLELREQFSVSSYPTIVFTDYDGSEIDRLNGYIQALDFKQRIESFVDSPDTFKGLQEKLEAQPGLLPAHFSMGEKYLERGRLFNAAKHFVQVIVSDPENLQGLTDVSYYWLAHTLATGGQPEEALSQLAKLSDRFHSSPILADAYLLQGQIHTFGNRRDEARQTFNVFLERFPGHEQRAWVEQLLKELDPPPMPLAASH